MASQQQLQVYKLLMNHRSIQNNPWDRLMT